MYFKTGNDEEAFVERVHRTWLEMLIQGGYRNVAAAVVDADLAIDRDQWQYSQMILNLPHTAYIIVRNDDELKQSIANTLSFVCHGYYVDQNDNVLDSIPVDYRVKLLDAPEGWRSIARDAILNAKDPNQGFVTEKMFSKRRQQTLVYNEMKFGSQSEIRIAQELERRGVLFLPLPLAVRHETGENWQDHKEPDFIICHDGVWGVLEVSVHAARFEQDSEKRSWFERSGILCYRPYSGERCYNSSAEVVDEFLTNLAKFKR